MENKRLGTVYEVLCEIRFAGVSGLPAGIVLPGMIFSGLQRDGLATKLEALPQAAIPLEIRQQRPEFHYLATHRIVNGEGMVVALGDRVMNISLVDAYDGWVDLRGKAESVFDKALASGILGAVERVSLKYLNLFRDDMGADQFRLINADIKIGSHHLAREPAHIRTEFDLNGVAAVVQIASQAKLESQAGIGHGGVGLVLDMDFVISKEHSNLAEIMESLDRAHSEANGLYKEIAGGNQ